MRFETHEQGEYFVVIDTESDNVQHIFEKHSPDDDEKQEYYGYLGTRPDGSDEDDVNPKLVPDDVWEFVKEETDIPLYPEG